MPMLGQTITVVNKSGKVVSTSKHLVNVFKEAKSAYRERKAEIQATKEQELEKQLSRQTITADPYPPSTRNSPPPPRSPVSRAGSTTSTRRSTRQYHGEPRSERRHSRRQSEYKQPLERGYTDSFYTNDRPRQRSFAAPTSPLRFMEEAEREKEGKELIRRRSLDDVRSRSSRRSSRMSRRDDTDIDMDLAYGELPPPLPVRNVEERNELKFKVTSLQRMLEEANCLQYSATAIIKSLESNPDAMAAVALTMAEISGLVSKVGPGALVALKGSFPAVIALLVSPEFLIAAGVGVGITVIALGGYKIVKRIKAKKEADKDVAEGPYDEMEEIQSDVDLDHIESWRRGIADAEAGSVGTSVDGELITPGAAKALREQGKLPPKRTKSTKEKKKDSALEKEAKKTREKKEKFEKRDRKERDELERKEKKREKDRGEKKKKDTSGLAMIFKGRRDEGLEKDLMI